MKRLVRNLSFFVSFLLLLSVSSCKIVEKVPFLNKEAETEIVDDVVYDDVYDDGFVEEETSDLYVEDELYEAFLEGNLEFNDTIDPFVLDSLTIALQERIDSENSGEAIVEESNTMMGMIDNVDKIPYFEEKKLESSSKSENIYDYPEGFVPSFPDSVYAERIEALRKQTTIELIYNSHVKSFIEVYAVNKREHTSKILGLADIYFPMFEEALDKYDMPLEIKYLAVVESALNPRAGSHAGAKGLWQFMYATGKSYNLNVNTLVDDRFDPIKSTDAACRHLTDLYNKYGDWFLALAAYNSGAGNVNKAIRRAGGLKNYWAVWPFLPRETRGYVPAFIAVNYVMNYSQEHNLYPIDPGIIADGVDSVTVHDMLHFEQLNEMLLIPMEDLKFFNPQYKSMIIPASAKNPMSLRIPEKFIDSFIVHEKEVYAYVTKNGISKKKLEEEIKKLSNVSFHIVMSGESLGSIAKKYHVSVNQLKTWNKLKSNTIYPKQKLVVYSSGAPMAHVGNTKPVMRSTEQKKHVVKSGENLSVIARKYKCSVTELKEWNKLKSNTLQVGQTLIVYPPTENEDSKVTTTTSGGYVIYKVKSGDNLYDIANKFDGVTISQICSLNDISKNSVLKVGQELKIKKKEGASVTHIVKSGDNLWDLSKKYGVTVEQIRKLNGLNSKSVLKVGQKLNIK